MEKITFKVCGDIKKQIIPVTISGNTFSQSESKTAIFTGSTDFFHDVYSLSDSINGVQNYDFENTTPWIYWTQLPEANWGLIQTTKTVDETIKKSKVASTLKFDTRYREENTLETDFFSVTPLDTSSVRFEIYSQDGWLSNPSRKTSSDPYPSLLPTELYTNYYPSVVYKKVNTAYYALYPALYKVQVDWYSSSVFKGTSILLDSFGTTSNITEWNTLPNETVFEPVPTWITKQGIVTVPSDANRAKIKISCAVDKISTSVGVIADSWSLVKSPVFRIDNIFFGGKGVSFLTVNPSTGSLTPPINPEDNPAFFDTNYIFQATPDATTEVLPINSFSTSGDCYGGTDNSFSSDGPILKLGKESNGTTYKTFIPFVVSFPETGGGISIKSVTLHLTSTVSAPVIANQITTLATSFGAKPNPTPPTTISALNVLGLENYRVRHDIYDNKEPGEEYIFDITEQAKMFFGVNSTTWTNGDTCSIVIDDYGSYQGTYNMKEVASFENPTYAAPYLTIETSNNVYTYEAIDSFIATSASLILDDKNYGTNLYLYIGENNIGETRRSLIKFDLSPIPTSATVTSAILNLYHSDSDSGNTLSGEIYAYPILKEWDMLGVTWNRRTGTEGWELGGLEPTSDYSDVPAQSSSGSIDSTGHVGWISIPIKYTIVDGWVKSPSTNNGLLLKMLTEGGNHHTFASSEGPVYFYEQEGGGYISTLPPKEYARIIPFPQLIVYYDLGGEIFSKTFRGDGSNTHIIIPIEPDDPVPPEPPPTPPEPPAPIPEPPEPEEPIPQPTPDPYNTSLLHFDTTTITDAKGVAWTASGGASISTTNTKFGSGSLNLTNYNSSITTPYKTDWFIGTNDFTFDFWINFSGATPLYNDENNAYGLRQILQVRNDENLWYNIYFDGRAGRSSSWNIHFLYRIVEGTDAFRISMPSTYRFATGTWYHVAFVRSGNRGYAFVNGKLLTDERYDPKVDIYTDNTYKVYMGASENSARALIDEFRYSKGIARWTSEFTLPSAPYL